MPDVVESLATQRLRLLHQMIPPVTRVILSRRLVGYFNHISSLNSALEFASLSSNENSQGLSRKASSKTEARRFQRLFQKTDWDQEGVLIEARKLIFERLGRSGVFVPSERDVDAFSYEVGSIQTYASLKRKQSGKLNTPKYKTCTILLTYVSEHGAAVINGGLYFNKKWTEGRMARERRKNAGLPISGLKRDEPWDIKINLINEAKKGSEWQKTRVIGYFSYSLPASWERITSGMLNETIEKYIRLFGYTNEELDRFRKYSSKASVLGEIVTLEIAATHAKTIQVWRRALALIVLGQAIKLYS